MNVIHLWIFGIVLLIPVHEFGHYLAAKKEGIYKGWGIFPNPHIKLKKPYGHRWGYLSGLAASLFLFPYWVWSQGWEPWSLFLAFCFAAACFDIPIFIFYGRLKKKR